MEKESYSDEQMAALLKAHVGRQWNPERQGCPPIEVLDSFARGQLKGTGLASVQRHLPECKECLLELRALRETLPEPRATAWASVLGVLRHPALAYLLVIALLYPAYRGLTQRPMTVKEIAREVLPAKPKEPSPEIASLRTIELKPAQRASQALPSVIRLSPGDKNFALSFFLAVSERPEFVYKAEILDSPGRVIAPARRVQPYDQLGKFLLLCRSDLFSGGAYELRVEEVNTATNLVRRTFSFPFNIELPLLKP